MTKSAHNPMHSMQKAHEAPRCRARSKRTKLPCKNPAVKGWRVCRMHGARGGSQSGKLSASYKHGGATKEIKAMRKEIAQIVRDFKKLVEF